MSKNKLADVAKENLSENFAPIDWVGMGGIELALVVKQADGSFRIPARADAKVSLDKSSSRGIHMSRLFLICQEKFSTQDLKMSLLGDVTAEFLKTHSELSTQALVKIHFEMPIRRKALISDNFAWRTYPLTLSCINTQGRPQYFVESLVTYSSTCPASAALSRQLIQQQFQGQFSDKKLSFDEIHQWLGTTEGIVATPHAQRSTAKVKIEVDADYDFTKIIDVVEDALQTAVQGAVKREDEQEFALRNGQNLMFCEDAARRVKVALDSQSDIKDYLAEFDHIESLHPHSAMSLISKGLSLRNF